MEVILREPTAQKESISFPLRARMALSPPPRAVAQLTVEFFQFGPATAQPSLFDRKEGTVPPSLKEAVKELKLKLGFSPLYRVVEVDPWSRIPERRHALLNFEP